MELPSQLVIFDQADRQLRRLGVVLRGESATRRALESDRLVHCCCHVLLYIRVGQGSSAGLLRMRQSTQFDPPNAIPQRLAQVRRVEDGQVARDDAVKVLLHLLGQGLPDRLDVRRLAPSFVDCAVFAEDEEVCRERHAFCAQLRVSQQERQAELAARFARRAQLGRRL